MLSEANKDLLTRLLQAFVNVVVSFFKASRVTIIALANNYHYERD